MTIRPFSKDDDIYEISSIYESSWKSAYKDIIPQEYLDGIPSGHWADTLKSPSLYSLLMLDGNKVIGTSSYSASRSESMIDYGEIISLYLLPEYTLKGYGKQLLKASVSGLNKMGFSNIFLWVLEENYNARRFYENFGFISNGTVMYDNIGGKVLRELQYTYCIC